MSRDRDPAALLRWYPSTWRDRYGAELVALMEDDLDGRSPTLRFRVSMAASGMRQRAHSAGLDGKGARSETAVRSGALVVLASWSALLPGGAAFAKASEHFDVAIPASGHGPAVMAYQAVNFLALTGALLVFVGVAVACPATIRFIRCGGWSTVRTPSTVAAVLTGAAGLATIGVGLWAHHLTVHQRNGGSVLYGVAYVGWAFLLAGTLVAWTWTGLALARRIDLDRNSLRIEARLAVAVAAIVGLTSVAVGVWWLAMARGAPWFLTGARPGTRPSVVTVQLVSIEGWMVAATAVALYGATRAIRSARTT